MHSEQDLLAVEAAGGSEMNPDFEPNPDFMGQQSADESAAKERYEYFTRPEPRENLSEIFYEDDPYMGKAKVRMVRIGMMRNAAEENRKDVKVYLDPYPHIRIKDAKPLQGWYKAKDEPKGKRPRPCFTEAILTEPYGGYCAVGCAFSLPAGELVDTPSGLRPINTLEIGEMVYGRSIAGTVLTRILATTNHRKPEGLIELKLSDGRLLRMTGDHPVYSIRRGWVAAETLTQGEELENVQTLLHRLPEADYWSEQVQELRRQGEGQAVETMQRLRNSDTQVESGMQRLLPSDKVKEWAEEPGKAIAESQETQVSGDQKKDVSVCSGTPRGDGRASQGSEVCCIQASSGQESASREVGVQVVKTRRVYRQKRTHLQNEISVGSAGGAMARLSESRLGLRAHSLVPTGRFSVSSRLQTIVRGCLPGGQGIHDSRGKEENRTSQGDGLHDQSARREGAQETGNPYVTGICRIPGEVQVYDIETETGNFYQQGILVHNCYINSGMRGYRGTGLISVPLEYGPQIGKQISKMRRGAAGYFSSFTDPFTPLELYYHNTQQAAEEFVKAGLPIFFLSRLRYPDWAIDLMTKNPHSYAQKSLNTSDPEDWRRLSPGALPLMEHLKDITRIKKAGVYVSIQVNPIVPGITSNLQILKLFKMLKEAGADHVIVKFVEAAYSWAPAMVKRMKKNFGEERGKMFEDLFIQNIGSEKTIDEEYRLKAHAQFSNYAKSIGLTYATCYEYRYEKNADGSIANKTGISIGREFTTAAQCHGHRVPMYTRDSESELFRPVEECPPSGCLYCASENDGQPRCGDELAGQATALRFSHLRLPIVTQIGGVNA